MILTVACISTAHATVLGNDSKPESPKPAAAPKPPPQETTVIIVNERTLVGPNSVVQVRGGRLYLPIASIAQALGDTFSAESTLRAVTIRRQNGTVAVFNAPLNEVRENGALVLTVSGTADLVFPPTANDLMLPAEIVAALLDVTVRRDQNNAIVISRKGVQPSNIRTGAKHAPWEIFQIEYDYNYSRYTSVADHNLVLRGTGRVGDARLSFIANSSLGVTRNSRRPTLEGGTVRLDRPNGQSFVGGEFGTGTDVEFLSAAVRGGLVQLPVHGVRLDFFGGQTTSGTTASNPENLRVNPYSSLGLNYDTKVFGAIVSTATLDSRQQDFTISGGAMHFDGANRKGDLVAGGMKYISGLNRLQVDVAAGQFSGVSRTGIKTSGTDMAVNVTGSYQLTEQLVMQGRYSYVGKGFLSPQTGLHEPTNLIAGGMNWQPRRWFTASLNASTATTPGRNQFNRYITGSVSIAPDNKLPALFITHTQSGTTQLRSSAFTLITATKKFQRWTMFFNGSRIKTFGDAALNAQIGGNIRVNEWNTLEVSQAIGSHGVYNGMATWQVANLFNNRLAFSGGLGYAKSNTASFHTTEHLSGTLKLPRNTSLQISYLKNQTGTTALLSLHGLFFSNKRAERAINGPLADLNSYASVYGRVYQDVNLNGRFDPNVDQPQANAQVRVDGNRYVVSDANGYFRIESVTQGEHSVYLDLLSVRADLTLLDNTQQLITIASTRDVIVDFRVVRTGRISGVVWLDLNENGKLDETEQVLSDVRVVTGSGRDTLTDDKGYFMIGDLPPGEHIVLIDEKTVPEQTRSLTGSQTIKVTAGNETTTAFPVAPLPDQIKKFSRD